MLHINIYVYVCVCVSVCTSIIIASKHSPLMSVLFFGSIHNNLLQAQEEGLLTIEIVMGEITGSTPYLDDIRPLFHRVRFMYQCIPRSNASVYSV